LPEKTLLLKHSATANFQCPFVTDNCTYSWVDLWNFGWYYDRFF